MIATATTRQTRNDEITIQRWLTDARRTGRKDNYAGKRRHPRFSWHAALTVEAVDDEGQSQQYATARDIGVGGMGLKTRRRIDANTIIRVTVDATGESLVARVRHCSEALGGFIIGVEFQSANPPPARKPLPAIRRMVA